ncbi:hypothetical protein CHX26_04135 [Porphyrobacter sp. HT-58-2]|uniref:hypothetical protein n=1 Tax=Porphyrobacter sp. HT-58-2 TaxID=2023229 RepID=UPI000CDC712B|nr:hypothetical protein [Porphyrobacter sp. HT-58-2]AUX68807.1 hypothetical protein CHX26_04135 [Porphyrobacter sp. HT-58-2]
MYTKVKSGEKVDLIVCEISDSGDIINSYRQSDVITDDLYFHVSEIGRGEIGSLSMKMARYFLNFHQWGISRLHKPCIVFLDLALRKNELEMAPHLRCIDDSVEMTRENLKLSLETLDIHIMRTDRGIIKNDAVKFIQFCGKIEPLQSKYFHDIFDGLSRYVDLYINEEIYVEGFSIKENLISIDVGS